MPPRSRISNFEWYLCLGFFALVDLVQIVLDAFVVGVVANRYIDMVAVGIMALYLIIRRYKFDRNDWLVLGGSFLAEEIPGVDIAPAWTFDIWRFMKKDKMRPLA